MKRCGAGQVTGICGRGRADRGRRTGIAASALAAALLVTGAGWPDSGSVAVASGARQLAQVTALVQPAPALVPGGEAAPGPRLGRVGRLRQADLLVVSARSLPAAAVRAVARMRGVVATESVDAARVQVNGRYVAILGVDPVGFRRFAAKPTARNTDFWRAVAGGALGISYTMGRQDKLPVGTVVTVGGRQVKLLPVGGQGTVGIAGVDAVLSRAQARSLGFPAGNALVVSAPHVRLTALRAKIKAAMPHGVLVEPLVSQRARAGGAGVASGSARRHQLSLVQVRAMLQAALSRAGMPYVWGAAGPAAFDCSGLVQWSFARAGIAMPRVAADQARTGPAVPVSRLQPGDLLFYHTDPTAPGYISHVAIYLGRGWMIQAPQPGMTVEVVPVALGPEFAGAVGVSPGLAARVAASPVG